MSHVLTHEEICNLLPARGENAHKGTSGRVLVIAGSRQFTGASVLAVAGALRAGAGLVTFAGVSLAAQQVRFAHPEAIIVDLGDHSTLHNQHLDTLRNLAKNADAVVIGPGISRDPAAIYAVGQLLAKLETPCVIDADALRAINTRRTTPTALTPHAGELAALLGIRREQVDSDRDQAATLAYERFGDLLLKGHHTIIAGSPLWINPTGNPGMATGGMGDVLSGVIGTFLAQGLAPREALAVGAYVHGMAGDICAKRIGPAGFTASEVAAAIPSTLGVLLAKPG
ncbi:MAG: NAD(P)H-hydrate dehydratase [Armatimonadetes bacterium]|nr:NAD(P)H-hydrate dehydratase [Armatimonadota bacterium]